MKAVRGALALAVLLGALAGGSGVTPVAASGPALPAWTTSAVRFDLRAVTCPDATHCYAVGSNADTPVIETSGNGGTTWHTAVLPISTGFLYSVFCLDATDCWAAGRGDLGGTSVAGIDIYTHDGGTTWTAGTPITVQQQTSTLPVYLGGITCSSLTMCWAVGDEVSQNTTQWTGEIWVSTDGGATWPTTETIADSSVAVVTGVSCLPGTITCYATADRSADQSTAVYTGTVLQRTVVGGQASWNDLSSVPAGITNLAGLSCVTASPSFCTAVGYQATGTASSAVTISSGDGGATWSSGSLPAGIQLLDGVACISATTCWAAGYSGLGPRAAGQIAQTTNGGLTWTQQTTPAGTGYLDGIGCQSSGTCLAVGYDALSGANAGLVLSNGGSGTWSTSQAILPDTEWSGASCADTAHCVVVGNSGGNPAIQATSNSGSTWTADTVPAGVSDLDAVSCPAAGTCWAVGYELNPASGSAPSLFKTAVVISTTDGVTWHLDTIPTGAASHLDGISCPTTTECVAVGSLVTIPATLTSTAAILATTNGTTWQAQPPPSGVGYLAAVSCASASACSATGTASAGGATAISTVTAPSGWSPDVIQQTANHTYDALVSVSCLPTECAAVGSQLVGPGSAQGFGLILTASRPGGQWTPQQPPGNTGGLFAVSCLVASPLNCVAAGNAVGAGTTGPPAVVVSPSSNVWADDVIPADVPNMRATSCVLGSTRCIAVGKNVVITTPSG